jgi:hypothetical protein
VASWRDHTSEQDQADLDALLNAVLPFAEQTLSKYGEMFPFGAAISSDGQLEMLASGLPEGGHPQSDVVLAGLYDGARTTSSTRRAFAFVADVRANATDAVRVELEHKEGTAIVVLIPYSRSRLKKKVIFGQISGTAGQPNVWRQG